MSLKTKNLQYVGKVSITILRQMKTANKAGFWSEKLKENREKIVKHSLNEHLDELTLKKISEQRRSDLSDTKLINDFMSFEQPEHYVKRDEHYLRALRVTNELFKPKKLLRPIHFPDLRYYPWTLNTSSEAPWSYRSNVREIIASKQAEGLIYDARRSFHNLYDEIFMENRLLIHLIKEGDPKFWTTDGNPIPYEFVNLHARSHIVGIDEEDKIRAVFGVTKLLLMAEQHFIWPLQEYYLNEHAESPLLWGNEMIKAGWRKLWNRAYTKAPFSTVLSLDWSQFDKRALHEIINDVHTMWRSYFDFNNGYVPTNFYPNSITEPDRIENLWKWTCYSIKHTPICLPDGRKYVWQRNGIASGFQQTQLLDSFVNTIMILTLLSKAGVNIEGKNFFIKVQGDDSLTTFPERIYQTQRKQFLERLAEMALEYFNAKLNHKKSQITEDLNDVKVLGYQNKMMMPYRTDYDLLSHLLYPERSFGLPELAASAVGIAWASLGCSRKVYSVCKDVHNFLIDKLGVRPNATSWMWLDRMGTIELNEFNIERFPSFDEIWNSTFSINTREDRMKERLYPTKLQSAGGFVFLPY